MIIIYKIILSFIILRLNAESVVSDESKNDQNGRKDKNTYRKMERRFIDNLDDAQWHVSHLKETDFAERAGCEGDTFEDKVRRYRKALRNDGALVEFVSADALPFNEKDLKEDVCKPVKPFLVNHKSQSEKSVTSNPAAIEPDGTVIDEDKGATVAMSAAGETQKDEKDAGKDKDADDKVKTGTTPTVEDVNKDQLNVATPAGGTREHSRSENGTAPRRDGRRNSEYMFSSVEYYDEGTNFDEAICPDDVEVITLQLDQIRNYDLKCEKVLLWRFLD